MAVGGMVHRISVCRLLPLFEVCRFGHGRYGTPDFGVPPSASLRGAPIWPLEVWYTGFRCASFCLFPRCADLAPGGMAGWISVSRHLPQGYVPSFSSMIDINISDRQREANLAVKSMPQWISLWRSSSLPDVRLGGVPIWPLKVWHSGFRCAPFCLFPRCADLAPGGMAGRISVSRHLPRGYVPCV